MYRSCHNVLIFRPGMRLLIKGPDINHLEDERYAQVEEIAIRGKDKKVKVSLLGGQRKIVLVPINYILKVRDVDTNNNFSAVPNGNNSDQVNNDMNIDGNHAGNTVNATSNPEPIVIDDSDSDDMDDSIKLLHTATSLSNNNIQKRNGITTATTVTTTGIVSKTRKPPPLPSGVEACFSIAPSVPPPHPPREPEPELESIPVHVSTSQPTSVYNPHFDQHPTSTAYHRNTHDTHSRQRARDDGHAIPTSNQPPHHFHNHKHNHSHSHNHGQSHHQHNYYNITNHIHAQIQGGHDVNQQQRLIQAPEFEERNDFLSATNLNRTAESNENRVNNYSKHHPNNRNPPLNRDNNFGKPSNHDRQQHKKGPNINETHRNHSKSFTNPPYPTHPLNNHQPVREYDDDDAYLSRNEQRLPPRQQKPQSSSFHHRQQQEPQSRPQQNGRYFNSNFPEHHDHNRPITPPTKQPRRDFNPTSIDVSSRHPNVDSFTFNTLQSQHKPKKSQKERDPQQRDHRGGVPTGLPERHLKSVSDVPIQKRNGTNDDLKSRHDEHLRHPSKFHRRPETGLSLTRSPPPPEQNLNLNNRDTDFRQGRSSYPPPSRRRKPTSRNQSERKRARRDYGDSHIYDAGATRGRERDRNIADRYRDIEGRDIRDRGSNEQGRYASSTRDMRSVEDVDVREMSLNQERRNHRNAQREKKDYKARTKHQEESNEMTGYVSDEDEDQKLRWGVTAASDLIPAFDGRDPLIDARTIDSPNEVIDLIGDATDMKMIDEAVEQLDDNEHEDIDITNKRNRLGNGSLRRTSAEYTINRSNGNHKERFDSPKDEKDGSSDKLEGKRFPKMKSNGRKCTKPKKRELNGKLLTANLIISSNRKALVPKDNEIVIYDKDVVNKNVKLKRYVCICNMLQDPIYSIKGLKGCVQCGCCGMWSHLRCTMLSGEEMNILKMGQKKFMCWSCIEDVEARSSDIVNTVVIDDNSDDDTLNVDGKLWIFQMKPVMPVSLRAEKLLQKVEESAGGESGSRRRHLRLKMNTTDSTNTGSKKKMRPALTEEEHKKRAGNVEELFAGIIKLSVGVEERNLVDNKFSIL